jgi:hypothetical protein
VPTQVRRPHNFAERIGRSSERRALGVLSVELAPIQARLDAAAAHEIAHSITRSLYDPELQYGTSLQKPTASLFRTSKTNCVLVYDIRNENVNSQRILHEQ